ncbi:MAG: AAA family ATPase, partial [Calditrichaeota bacterium]|nr:AAA family ATPase [Calditrichota bacterium]
MKILFIIGKGGVGKSSLSALCGLHLSQKNKKVLITSLDPA